MPKKLVTCRVCKGTGFSKCDECSGTGSVEKVDLNMISCGDGILRFKVRCPKCKGVGKTICYACHGNGKLEIDEKYIEWSDGV